YGARPRLDSLRVRRRLQLRAALKLHDSSQVAGHAAGRPSRLPEDPLQHHPHGHSLAEDLARLRQRRATLRWLGAGTLAALAGCGGGSSSAAATVDASVASASSTTGASCAVIPSETSGPYPGDGTNSGTNRGVANALTETGIVRSDITG